MATEGPPCGSSRWRQIALAAELHATIGNAPGGAMLTKTSATSSLWRRLHTAAARLRFGSRGTREPVERAVTFGSWCWRRGCNGRGFELGMMADRNLDDAISVSCSSMWVAKPVPQRKSATSLVT